MTYYIQQYDLDIQIRTLHLVPLDIRVSTQFTQNEIDIIGSYFPIVFDPAFACEYPLTPKSVIITYIDSTTLRFNYPHRPGTTRYLEFLDSLDNNDDIRGYELLPEKINNKWLLRYFNG